MQMKSMNCKDIPEDFGFDHAFECVGGDASQEAIRDIIKCIKPPRNALILMGVSETEINRSILRRLRKRPDLSRVFSLRA